MRDAGRPTGSLRNRIEDAEPTRISHVAATERHRVHAQSVRQLIDRLLGCEGDREVHRRAQIAALEIAVEPRHVMVDQPHVRHGIDGAQCFLVDEARASADRRLHRCS